MEERTKAEIVCDAICGLIMLVSVAVFVIVGICTDEWHPTWLITVIGAVVCGIISIVCNAVVGIKKVDAKKQIELVQPKAVDAEVVKTGAEQPKVDEK